MRQVVLNVGNGGVQVLNDLVLCRRELVPHLPFLADRAVVNSVDRDLDWIRTRDEQLEVLVRIFLDFRCPFDEKTVGGRGGLVLAVIVGSGCWGKVPHEWRRHLRVLRMVRQCRLRAWEHSLGGDSQHRRLVELLRHEMSEHCHMRVTVVGFTNLRRRFDRLFGLLLRSDRRRMSRRQDGRSESGTILSRFDRSRCACRVECDVSSLLLGECSWCRCGSF